MTLGPSRLAALLAAACAFAFGLWFLPPTSDGALALQDGVWYGHDAETQHFREIHPHHPLFHVLAAAATYGLEALHVSRPGHVAVRLLSAAGGAWCVALITLLAGRRWWIGLMAAALLASTRMFWIEVAGGETVPLGLASLLALLSCALAPGLTVRRLVTITVLALLLRQDNVLAVPVVAVLAWMNFPAGTRARRIATWLAVAGALTILGYFGAWALDRTQHESFVDYVRRFAVHGAWPSLEGRESPIGAIANALSIAWIGRHWPLTETHVWLGILALVAGLAAGWLARGDEAPYRFAWAAAAVVVIRTGLFAWFEPHNPEWQLAPIACVAATVAVFARGEPVVGRTRNLGLAVLAVLPLAVVAGHVSSSMELRQERGVEAIAAATRSTPKPYRLMTQGWIAPAACALLDLHWEQLPGAGPDALAALTRELAKRPERTLVLTDRFVIDGMPHTLHHLNQYADELDRLPEPPGVKLLRREGLVIGVLVDLPK